jgi:translation initiation factor 1
MAKNNKGRSGIVYSTDPEFSYEEENAPENFPDPGDQLPRVRLETKQRAGKPMTVVSGIITSAEKLEDLARRLKMHCGTGGSAKEGEVLIQGDQRLKVVQWLHKQGYTKAK